MWYWLKHLILDFRSFLYNHGFYLISDPIRNIAGTCFIMWILIGIFKTDIKVALFITLGLCLLKEGIDIAVASPCCWEYFKNNSIPDLSYRVIGIVIAVIPFAVDRMIS